MATMKDLLSKMIDKINGSQQYVDDSFNKYFEGSGDGDTLYFNGDFTGLESTSYGKGLVYKISEATPSYAQINKAQELGGFVVNTINTLTGLSEENITISLYDYTEEYGYMYFPVYDGGMNYLYIYVLYEGNSLGSSSGIYVSNNTLRLTSLTILGYGGFESAKLKKQYLPEITVPKKVISATGRVGSYCCFLMDADMSEMILNGTISDARFYYLSEAGVLSEMIPTEITFNDSSAITGFRFMNNSIPSSSDVLYAITPNKTGVWMHGM